MNPLSSHTFSYLSTPAGGGGPDETAAHVSAFAQTALTNLTTTTATGAAMTATHLSDPSSGTEAVAALALCAMAAGGGIEPFENLSTKGIEAFYVIKEVREKLFPREKIEPWEAPAELKNRRAERPERIFKEEVAFSDPRQKTIAMPTDEGLMLLSAYYRLKYNVDILVTGSPEKLAQAICGEGLPKTENIWGIIATSGEEGVPHVTPMICARQPDGLIQLVNLDSVLNPIENYGYALQDLKDAGVNILISRPKEERQADSYSCRTDALVVLKDALRELKGRGVRDVMSFLRPEKEGRKLTFDFPPSWGKTVQLSAALENADVTTRVIGKKGESLGDFHSKYKTPMQKRETFSVGYRTDEGYYESEEVTLEKTIRVNRFLNYKGKKNLELVRRLVESGSKPLESVYRDLHAFYV